VTKIFERTMLRQELFILPQFQRFQSLTLGSIDSGPVVRKNTMEVGTCGRGYPPHRGQEAEKERGQLSGITFRGTAPVIYFLQLDPTS
jgi:hypothetical protein